MDEFYWNSEVQQAFEQLKHSLTATPILASPPMKEPFILYSHASQLPNGAFLAQLRIGLEGVNCYAFKCLSNAQSLYSTTKRELLAKVFEIRQFKYYFFGRSFKILTDNRTLQCLHSLKDLDALSVRWLDKVAAVDHEIEHRRSKSIGQADCVSRLPPKVAAATMTTTAVNNPSLDGQPHSSSESLPSPNSQTPPAKQSKCTIILQDTNKVNQTDDEQSEVKQFQSWRKQKQSD